MHDGIINASATQCPRAKCFFLIWLWQKEIDKLDLIWRLFWNSEVWTFWVLEPVFMNCLLCTIYWNQFFFQNFAIFSFDSEPLSLKKSKKMHSLSDFPGIYSIFFPAFCPIMFLMKPPKNFEKIAILKIWELVSFWGVKTHFS